MQYRFAVEREDYSDYAGGRVFYSSPGQPAFPVRLASEIFQRCLSHRQGIGPGVVYDPCCGGAYHLAVLGYLHGRQIRKILASDVNAAVLPLAQRNLSLLTKGGLAERIGELEQLYEKYQKPSHAEALTSARRLQERWQRYLQGYVIPARLFVADVMDKEAVKVGVGGQAVDMVFSDIPYGWLSAWRKEGEDTSPIWQMLESLRSVLAPEAVVAIVTDKRQKVVHEGYGRLERFQVGKRRVWLGRPL